MKVCVHVTAKTDMNHSQNEDKSDDGDNDYVNATSRHHVSDMASQRYAQQHFYYQIWTHRQFML